MNTGHGNHWECLGKPVEELLPQLIPLTCSRGKLGPDIMRVGQFFDDAEPLEHKLSSIIYAPEVLGFMAVVVSNTDKSGVTFLTGYPYAKAAPCRKFRLLEIQDWDNECEGVLIGETGGSHGAFFDTHYFLNRDTYQVGEEYDFRLAGLIYKARCINDETVQIENPDTIREMRRVEGGEPERLPDGSLAPVIVHLAGASGLVPASEECPDDAEFYCVIEAVEEFLLEGIRIFQIRPKIEDDTPSALPAVIFGEASQFQDCYIPKAGDSLGGMLWMQGFRDEPTSA